MDGGLKGSLGECNVGMYDNVKFVMECPVCKAPVTGFQSKDGRCVLGVLSPKNVSNFYSHCSKCGAYINFERKYEESAEIDYIPLDEVLKDFDMEVRKQ